MTTEPTGDELDEVLCNQWPAFSMQATLVRMWVRQAMRDAIARWGQPSGAGEPVAWYVTGCGRLLDEDEAKAEARHIGGTARAIPLYTAARAVLAKGGAQPVVREPLTHAQAKALVLKYGNDPLHLVLQVERHHGIKAKEAGNAE